MFVLLSLLLLSSPQDDLTENVQLYWDALQVSDKASALKFVHPEDLNNFINRREARFKSWKLLDTEIKSENEAVVRIQLERILSNGVVGPVRGKETWVKHEGSWKVRVMSSGEQYRKMLGGYSSRYNRVTEKSKSLEVRTDKLNFYAISPTQPRFLRIWNGLDAAAKIEEVSVDAERFKVLQFSEKIEAQSTGTVKIQYTGSETGENLESEIRLRLLQNGETKEFVVPVVYNYMDEISRWVSRQQPKKTEP
jgi:hypothetical protein